MALTAWTPLLLALLVLSPCALARDIPSSCSLTRDTAPTHACDVVSEYICDDFNDCTYNYIGTKGQCWAVDMPAGTPCQGPPRGGEDFAECDGKGQCVPYPKCRAIPCFLSLRKTSRAPECVYVPLPDNHLCVDGNPYTEEWGTCQAGRCRARPLCPTESECILASYDTETKRCVSEELDDTTCTGGFCRNGTCVLKGNEQ